jgi:hypothetical protein
MSTTAQIRGDAQAVRTAALKAGQCQTGCPVENVTIVFDDMLACFFGQVGIPNAPVCKQPQGYRVCWLGNVQLLNGASYIVPLYAGGPGTCTFVRPSLTGIQCSPGYVIPPLGINCIGGCFYGHPYGTGADHAAVGFTENAGVWKCAAQATFAAEIIFQSTMNGFEDQCVCEAVVAYPSFCTQVQQAFDWSSFLAGSPIVIQNGYSQSGCGEVPVEADDVSCLCNPSRTLPCCHQAAFGGRITIYAGP